MSVIYKNSLNFMTNIDKKLLGLSLLVSIMIPVSFLLCGVIPIVGVVFSALLACSLKNIFLSSYIKRKNHSVNEIFTSFSDFKHVTLGLLWTGFRTYIWLLIPIAGIFMAVYKSYEYRFVPYILMTRKDVKPLEASDVSAKETEGYKTYMFVSDVIMIASLFFAEAILYAMSFIPTIGLVFKLFMVVLLGLCIVFYPYIYCVLSASFYTEIKTKCVHPLKKAKTCPFCLAKLKGNEAFCSNCGEKIIESQNEA